MEEISFEEFVKKFYPDIKLQPFQEKLIKQISEGDYVFIKGLRYGRTTTGRLVAEYNLKFQQLRKENKP